VALFVVGVVLQFCVVARARARHMMTIDIILKTARASVAYQQKSGHWPRDLADMLQPQGTADWWEGYISRTSDAWGHTLEYEPFDPVTGSGRVRSSSIQTSCGFYADQHIQLQDEGRYQVGLFRVRWVPRHASSNPTKGDGA